MSKEPDTEMPENEKPTKLLIDDPSDFQFHAAYLAYSESWDNNDAHDQKLELNAIILSLSKKEMDYSDFYRRLDQFRGRKSNRHSFPRRRIETQKKRDWRKRQTKSMRESRHRGRH